MTELEAELLRRKLATIGRNLDDLREIEGLSVTEYRKDRFRQKGTERLLQEIVEAAVDANVHLLRAHGEPSPTDYRASFVELGRVGVISRELAHELAPAAGLRNRLVHQYDEIDDAIVLRAVTQARSQFSRYVAAVEDYLSSQGL